MSFLGSLNMELYLLPIHVMRQMRTLFGRIILVLLSTSPGLGENTLVVAAHDFRSNTPALC